MSRMWYTTWYNTPYANQVNVTLYLISYVIVDVLEEKTASLLNLWDLKIVISTGFIVSLLMKSSFKIYV